MAKITKVELVDLGTGATEEVDCILAANATLDRWAVSLPPHTKREFEFRVYTDQGLPPTDDPAKASKREMEPTKSVRFWLEREDHGFVHIDAFLVPGDYTDPARYVVGKLLSYHQELNEALVRQLLRAAPHRFIGKAVGRWLMQFDPDLKEVVLEESLEGD